MDVQKIHVFESRVHSLRKLKHALLLADSPPMKQKSLSTISAVKEVPPDLFKTLTNSVMVCTFSCLIGLSPLACGEVLYEETFDRPIVTTGAGITDPRLGWIGLSPTLADALVQGSEPKLSGHFLDGSTATPTGFETLFVRKFPAVTSGVVSLSCVALAKSALSISSSVGLTHHSYTQRQSQWTCVPGGWTFYVGRIDQTGHPYSDLPLGVYVNNQEFVAVPYDTAVTLRVIIDMDRNKAWGVAQWVAGGVPQSHITAEYDWDIGLSNVSTVFVSSDRRSSKIGIGVDDIKVEGERHVIRPHPFVNTEHTIFQHNGTAGAIPSDAEIYWVSRDWVENAQMPYLAWMPEQSKLFMLFESGYPIKAAMMTSTDGGVSWSAPSLLPASSSYALGLVNLGGGQLLATGPTSSHNISRSTDYGVTWTGNTPSPVPSPEIYLWDPPVVTGPAGGGMYNMASAGHGYTGEPWGSSAAPYSQGYIRFSTDSGATWGNAISVPQWLGINEVTMIKAANGNLIAAGRTDYPARFAESQVDQFSGLVVSISTDNGATWSAVNHLYEWGRHHPCMVLMPNGDIVMTYVVRMGYTPDEKGFPRYGVEAVISKDDGVTWDLDHRIILATWSGNVKGDKLWYGGVQSTSTVVLPDGTLVTAFGTGFENAPETTLCQMDVALVRWKIPTNTLNSDTYFTDLPYNADARNIINPRMPIAKKTVKSFFSMGYGWNNHSWNTTETSTANTLPGSDFTLAVNFAGMTGSNTGPVFANRVLGSIGASTSYQASIVDGFEAEMVASYSGSVPADAAPNPNYQVTLNINAISIQNAPNIISPGQTINFYEVTPGYELEQDPQATVATGNFTMLPTWNKTVWDPEEPLLMAGAITQTRVRTFVLEQDAYYDMYIDGLEIAGDVSLTYDAVTPVIRKTITSTFSKGFGWNNHSWNTTETTSANVEPNANFQVSFNFGSPGSATLSNTGPTFSSRVLGPISTSTAHQAGYPLNFVANVTGKYAGTVPVDAAGNPNYKVKVVIDSISINSAPVLLTAGQTLNFNETTSGHASAQSPQAIPTTGNFTVLSSWQKYAWNPGDFESAAGILQQPQTRTFTLTEASSDNLAIDGLEISGHIELSYDAVP